MSALRVSAFGFVAPIWFGRVLHGFGGLVWFYRVV